MWHVRVGGIQPESRTTDVGEFDDLDAVRAYLAPLVQPDVKLVERHCDDGCVQFILKHPETRGVVGLESLLEAVVFEAEVMGADDVRGAVAGQGPHDSGVEQAPG